MSNEPGYAQDITNLIQSDLNRQAGVNEAIIRDEERLRTIESELHKISGRLEDNRKYRDLLITHLPYRIRAHELLCADMGWVKPNFSTPRPPVEPSRPGYRPVGDDTWDKITGRVEASRSPIGDKAEQDMIASRQPVARETVEYLMRPEKD